MEFFSFVLGIFVFFLGEGKTTVAEKTSLQKRARNGVASGIRASMEGSESEVLSSF